MVANVKVPGVWGHCWESVSSIPFLSTYSSVFYKCSPIKDEMLGQVKSKCSRKRPLHDFSVNDVFQNGVAEN